MLRTYRKLMTLQRKVHLLIIAITYKFTDLHFTCNMEEDSGNTICKHCSNVQAREAWSQNTWAVQFQNKDAINVSSENLNKKCMNLMRKKKWKII